MKLRVDLLEGARIALGALGSNRLRTSLNTLGVAIGVATLLAIVGIIQGLDKSFADQLATMGSNTLEVSKMPWVMMGNWWEFRNRKPLSEIELEAIKAQAKYVVAVAPKSRRMADVSFLDASVPMMEIVGSSADYITVSGHELSQGRFFTEGEDEARSFVAVLGADVAETLFPLSNPLGASVRINNRPFTVVGTLSRKGKILDQSMDSMVVVPYGTHTALWGKDRRRGISLNVLVRSPLELDAAEDELVGILRRARSTPPGKPDDFSINRPEQLASTYQQLTGALYGVAVGIGLITLLVGGIGIMNIMLVSVRERTREIGVRRALGARKRTIIMQFILESVAVSAVGGVLGTATGLGGALLVSQITLLSATVRPLTVVLGVLFASVVGLVFGIWPAARAASLNPVDALRHE